MKKIDKSKVKRILIIKLRGIGDVVLSTIVVKNLKKDFPDSEISYLTEEPSKPVLENISLIKNVLVLEKMTLLNKIKMLLLLRQYRFDLILDFYSNPTTALFTFLSGARYKAGFPYKGRKYAYNLFGPAERNKYHAALLHIEFLKMLGIESSEKEILFQLNNEDKLFINNFLSRIVKDKKMLVGLCPTGGWSSKKCDPAKLAEIGNHITQKYDANVLIIWGPGDENDAKDILLTMKTETTYLAPKTNLLQMAAMISKCTFVICNDSGPMHIAAALKVPVLALFGPTDPELQGPFGEKHEWINLLELDCIKCNLLECPKNHECFLQLPIRHIMEKVDSLIKKNGLQV